MPEDGAAAGLRAWGWSKTSYSVTFQSRFGKAKWLEPYTEPTLRALAQRGLARVDVVCPGFTGDCLETLEEIAQEGAMPSWRRAARNSTTSRA